jgi:hypothetical protein
LLYDEARTLLAQAEQVCAKVAAAAGTATITIGTLAGRASLHTDEVADRRWFRLPEGTDPVWQAYWNGGRHRDGPVVRTAHECLQAVLWNGTVGLAPLAHALPEGLTCVPLVDLPPSRLVVAWSGTDPGPLVRSFARIAAAVYGAPASQEDR